MKSCLQPARHTGVLPGGPGGPEKPRPRWPETGQQPLDGRHRGGPRGAPRPGLEDWLPLPRGHGGWGVGSAPEGMAPRADQHVPGRHRSQREARAGAQAGRGEREDLDPAARVWPGWRAQQARSGVKGPPRGSPQTTWFCPGSSRAPRGSTAGTRGLRGSPDEAPVKPMGAKLGLEAGAPACWPEARGRHLGAP